MGKTVLLLFSILILRIVYTLTNVNNPANIIRLYLKRVITEIFLTTSADTKEGQLLCDALKEAGNPAKISANIRSENPATRCTWRTMYFHIS